MALRPIIHLLLHALVPAIAARLGWKKRWKQAWLVMVATMVVDLDHLLATPIYDPNRCSIGFHPLHSDIACAIYLGLLFVPKARLVALGLVIHMALDFIDCYWMRMLG